jgi:dephospho-CoA kinase
MIQKTATTQWNCSPWLKRHFKQWLLDHKEFPIVIYEAAILFESGNYKDFDLIITVTAPLESRIQRVIERDKQHESRFWENKFTMD